MNEDKFRLSMWAIIGTISVTLVACAVLYFGHQNDLIASMVKGGANPVTVSCAFSPYQDVCKFAQVQARDRVMYMDNWSTGSIMKD